jgi:hydroxymethylbilane synthase
MKPLIIGSRGSRLALWQSNFIREEIRNAHPGIEVEILVIKTTGDKISESSLGGFSGTGKGIFIKEIEEALLAGEVDLAVHSLKDVPTDLAPEFALGAIPPRGDVRDALVAGSRLSRWEDFPARGTLGTSSLRRSVQLKSLQKDLQIQVLRGNVDTRLRKRIELGLDGIVLAAAGLKRLGFEDQISYLFPPDVVVPAVGQGALAIEARAGDGTVLSVLSPLEHPETRSCVQAERTFLKLLGGGCQVPMGALAEIVDGTSRFTAVVANPNREQIIRYASEGQPEALPEMASAAAEYLMAHGAAQIMRELELT